jgi:predicted double-glycine peptidase
MEPYIQTTSFTTAASSLLTLLHHFNTEIKLTRENEFNIWRRTVNLPTRASSIYGLAIIIKQNGLEPIVVVENKKYDFPDYRFHRYKKVEIEQAEFSSDLFYKKAKEKKIKIEKRPFLLEEVKEILNNHFVLLRINASPIRNKKNTSQYILIIKYKNDYFQIIDPAVGALSIPYKILESAFNTLETKKFRNHRMILVEKKKKKEK